MNAGNPIGVGYTQASIGNGTRSSSATSYLAPAFLARPNLTVLVNSEVTKLVKASHDVIAAHSRPNSPLENRLAW
jgi:choline dehydrogenase-like flavoprotein